MNDFVDIPVLDLTALIEGDDISALTADFARAYGETGFAYVINHGIDHGASEAVFAASRDFHALPERAKQAIACLLYTSPSPRDQRGSRMPSSA